MPGMKIRSGAMVLCFHGKGLRFKSLTYKMDDTAAREEWGWNPQWDLDRMTQDMLKVIKEKHEKGLI